MADHQYQCTACSHYSQTGPLIGKVSVVRCINCGHGCFMCSVCHLTCDKKFNLTRHYDRNHSLKDPPVPTPPGNHVDVSFGGESNDYSDVNSESDSSSQETSTRPDDSQSDGEGSFHAAEADMIEDEFLLDLIVNNESNNITSDDSISSVNGNEGLHNFSYCMDDFNLLFSNHDGKSKSYFYHEYLNRQPHNELTALAMIQIYSYMHANLMPQWNRSRRA